MTLGKMDKDRGIEIEKSVNGPTRFKIGNLGLGGEARAFGTSAFAGLSVFFLEQLKGDPTCEGKLIGLLGRDVAIRKLTYEDVTLADEAFCEWVKLCVEKAITDFRAETGRPLEEGWGGARYINLEPNAQVLETIILKGSKDGRSLVWNNKYARVEAETKPWFGPVEKAVLASLAVTVPASACATIDPSPKPAITAEAPIEITEAINELYPTSTPFTQIEMPTAVTVTETPEPIEAVCAVDAIAELREEGLQANYTVPVLTETGYAEALAEVNPLDVSTEVEFDIRRIIEAKPTNIKVLIIPDYIAISLLDLGEDIPFEIVNYEPGMDMAQEGIFLLSVHAGPNGWTTAIWENSIVDRRSDNSARINGLLYEFTSTTDEAGDEIDILYQVPNQKDDNTQADIAVGNCGPIVVRIESGSDWAVKSLLNSAGIDISKKPEGIWQNYEEKAGEEVSPESKLLSPGQVSEKTDAEIIDIVGIPDYKEFSLSEELIASKILRNEGGSSYLLYANKDGVVRLARNLETGLTEHAVYAEYEGGVNVMILTGQDVVDKDEGWSGLNEDYPDAQARLAKATNRALSFTWWAQKHPDDFTGYTMYSLSEIPGFQPVIRDLLTKNQRQRISDYILGEFLEAVQTAKNNGTALPLELPDRNRAEFNAAGDTLIIKAELNKEVSPNWVEIMDGIQDNRSVRNVTSERSGSVVTLHVKQTTFVSNRVNFRPVGGTILTFLRYFFGNGYFQANGTTSYSGYEEDMTGPILDDLCSVGLLPDQLQDYYDQIYPIYDTGKIASPTEGFCAVGFTK